MTTGTLALIILAAILAQVAIVMLSGFFRRRREFHNLNKSADDVKNISRFSTPAHASAEAVNSDLAWDDFKEFTVQRRQMEDANNEVCSFTLIPSDGKPLAVFKPGQFLTFKLPIRNPDTGELRSVVRCYSLSDAPHPDHYRISIKRMLAPVNQPDVPPGVSSGYFHDQVQKGSRLMVKAPSGHFHLREEEALPIVLIGGGIGITPMLSILNSVLETGITREIWLYYGVYNGAEHMMKQQLQTLASTHDNFHLHICYNAPNENDVEGVDYQHRGMVSIPLLRDTLELQRYQFYVCGPRPMMESLVPGLQEWGVDSGDIYYESFGPASIIKHMKSTSSTSTQPITVTFSRSGKSILWDPGADSLLDFAEANDIQVESGCRAGSCGSCQTAMQAGEVDYNQEPDANVEPGYCLLCIATPKCDLTLEA